jgi:putative nucleotidyltransferase with HDIG domain
MQQYHSLFNDFLVSLWIVDFSDIKKYIDELKAEGVRDLRRYLESHPEVVARCIAMTKVIDVNRYTLQMYKAESKEELIENLNQIFRMESYDMFKEQLIALSEGKTIFEGEGVIRTLAGEKKHIAVRWSVPEGYERTFAKVTVCAHDITGHKQAEDEIKRYLFELQVLNSVFMDISSSLETEKVLKTIVKDAAIALHADAATVALLDKDRNTLSYPCFHNMPEAGKRTIAEKGIDEITEDIITTGQSVIVENCLLPPDVLLAVPLITLDKPLGVLGVFGFTPGRRFTKDDLILLEFIGRQAATAIENARHYNEQQAMFDSTIRAFVHAVDAKSLWMKGHSERVSTYAKHIAIEMGLDEKIIKSVHLAGLLHDIGKIGTYDHLQDKPVRLTEEEFEKVKKHPVYGETILKNIRQLEEIAALVRHHHERVDGKGYPDGLKRKEIPLCARILHVADSFDAMTTDRPYRISPGIQYAVSELTRHAGSQFDPEAVEAFLRLLDKQNR